jgi:ribosomal protein S18 acetylase RimI-like enzyme
MVPVVVREARREDAQTMGAHTASASAAYGREEDRNAGRGALLDKSHELLAKRCDEAELAVFVGNARAQRFYERNGWRFVEQVVEPHFGGEQTEVCKYRRRLR